MVFQDPFNALNPSMTIRRALAEPLRIQRKLGGKALQDEINRLITMVGLSPSTQDRLPREFSGGQRQRICLARALALQPRLIVLDEPTSALDVSVQAQILNLLLDLKAEFGLTYLFISHDLGVVEHLVDRVAVMHQGAIVELGTREQIFARPQHAYTRMLLASALTPEPGLGVPDIAAFA